MLDDRRVGARDFDYYVRELFNRVMMRSANVVGFARFEVFRDVRSRADSVGEKGRRAVVTAKDRVGLARERAIKKAAVDRAVRTVILAWSISIEKPDDDRLRFVLDRRVSYL